MILQNELLSDVEFEKVSTIIYGPYGMGTEIFEGLTKEQKGTFKLAFKEITSRYNKAYMIYNKNKRNEELSAIKKMISDLQEQINMTKNNLKM